GRPHGPAARSGGSGAREPRAHRGRNREHDSPGSGQIARAVSGLLWPCFAVSGAAALGLELLWMRSAGLVLGATAPTAAVVLAGYFAGLGAGAALARGAPRRPIARYTLLELGAAAGALWSVAVFRALSADGARDALGP